MSYRVLLAATFGPISNILDIWFEIFALNLSSSILNRIFCSITILCPQKSTLYTTKQRVQYKYNFYNTLIKAMVFWCPKSNTQREAYSTSKSRLTFTSFAIFVRVSFKWMCFVLPISLSANINQKATFYQYTNWQN